MSLVLVADDDRRVGEIIRLTLAERGHVVGIVASGEEALNVLAAKSPRLVILDCSMPGMGGVEALRQIRSSPRHFATPVLMLTGRLSHQDEEIALRAGADEYLRKPFDPTELLVVAERLIARSLSRRAACART